MNIGIYLAIAIIGFLGADKCGLNGKWIGLLLGKLTPMKFIEFWLVIILLKGMDVWNNGVLKTEFHHQLPLKWNLFGHDAISSI